MRNIVIFLFVIAGLFFFAGPAGAQETAADTVVVTSNGTLRFRVVSHEEFFRTPAKPVTDKPFKWMGLEELREAFAGEYEFVVEPCGSEKNFVVRKDGKEHIRMYGYGRFAGYYPEQDILMLEDDGHASDIAVFLRSGKKAFNPSKTIYSRDGEYRLTGYYNGQENDIYELWKYDDATKEWQNVVSLTSILETLPPLVWGYCDYIYDAYFHEDALWYRTVYWTKEKGYTSVWVAVKLF